jgi:hypothetical protein
MTLKAHLRRATPCGQDRLRERARATGESRAAGIRSSAPELPGVSPLRSGSFARALPGGSPTGAAAAAHGYPASGRDRSPP